MRNQRGGIRAIFQEEVDKFPAGLGTDDRALGFFEVRLLHGPPRLPSHGAFGADAGGTTTSCGAIPCWRCGTLSRLEAG